MNSAEQDMKPVILAYCDRDSVRPGEQIAFKVSCEGAAAYRADIVRLVCCETSADGPGLKEHELEANVRGEYQARRQTIPIGSYVVVPEATQIQRLGSFTVMATIWPTRRSSSMQAILGDWSEPRRSGFFLGLDEAGALTITVGGGTASFTLSTNGPLPLRRWYRVAASYDATTSAVRLYQKPIPSRFLPPAPAAHADGRAECRLGGDPGQFLIAAYDMGDDAGRLRTGAHFDGKIERPVVVSRAMAIEDVIALSRAPLSEAAATTDVVAVWDFSIGIETDHIHDRGPNALHGTAVNLPARGSTGSNFSGDTWCWQHARHEYGAIHFHSDDLYDAGWATDFTLTIPADWRSGIYAARLRADGAEFHVPFYVRPSKGRRTADVAFLVPTATYMAYANNFGRVVSPVTDALIGKLTVVDETDLLMLSHRELGLSTYDAHLDGSSVNYSSRLRPITNHRPREPDISMAYNNLAPDLLIVDWLETIGQAYDVLTDEDLHHEGARALDGYRVVVTGTHPEYCSARMLDALQRFTHAGGRLMYLGGNGFYWRVAFRPDKPGVVELRRAQTNAARWNPGPGQYFHSFTGEHGGLWRDLGRPPQVLVGVGFISQGFDSSSYYRRARNAVSARTAFIFDGVDDDIIGNFGLMRGGAAGVEIDRYEARRGSPPHAVVLASSEGHTNVYLPFEETVAMGEPIDDQRPAIRADMVFFECPNGGAVFSVGSIAYAGSLSYRNYDNNVARITGNVMRRFLDPEPFVMPADTAGTGRT